MRSKRRSQVRWLVRRGDVDYGPYRREELLELIETRDVDMGTMVADTATMDWQPAGVHELFREHFAACLESWKAQALDDEVVRSERKLRAMGAVKGGVSKLLLGGIVLALALGGWLTWRMMRAEPTGIMTVVRSFECPSLPELPSVDIEARPPALVSPVVVTRLTERSNRRRPTGAGAGGGSTAVAGVVLEGQGAAPVTRLDFDDDAADTLSETSLARIEKAASKGLVRCGKELKANTRVSFIVKSGRLGSFTVGRSALGNRAFKRCISQQLKRVKVPRFAGSERRVTIPLMIE